MGLGGMRERLDFVGGQLEIYSEPGKGTKIIASIPSGDWNRKG
jgi:signal transduction histidine kinase